MLNTKIMVPQWDKKTGRRSVTVHKFISITEHENLPDDLEQSIIEYHANHGFTSSIDWTMAKKYYINESKHGCEFWLIHRRDAGPNERKVFTVVSPELNHTLEFLAPITEVVLKHIFGLLGLLEKSYNEFEELNDF